MKIIRDDISKLKRLDKQYDKLAESGGSDSNAKKDKIGQRITDLRSTIMSEFDRRKTGINEQRESFLDNHEDAEDSKKITKWDDRLEHINSRMADVDEGLDPALTTNPAEDAEEGDSSSDRLSRLESKLESAESDSAKERIQKRIDRLNNRESGNSESEDD